MSRTTRSFRFPELELEKWQAAADEETVGNLTEWLRRAANERLEGVSGFDELLEEFRKIREQNGG